MTTHGGDSRVRKGRNFTDAEERQVCRSVLQISQDSIQGNGQRKEAFWDRVSRHFNENCPSGVDEHQKRSLETKKSVIKHDVSKFISIYGHCYTIRESGTSLDDVLQNALDLYKVKDAKQRSFVFLHCWLLLKDCPRWMETPEEWAPATPQRPRETIEIDEEEAVDVEEMPHEDADMLPTPVSTSTVPRKRQCPLGNKVAKED